MSVDKATYYETAIRNLIDSIEENYGSELYFSDTDDEVEVEGTIDADLILMDLQQILRNAPNE